MHTVFLLRLNNVGLPVVKVSRVPEIETCNLHRRKQWQKIAIQGMQRQ